MSVYIKDISMPINCWECHFGHGDTGVCVVDFKQHGDWNEPQNCPLVNVPPHGRLIDADALCEGRVSNDNVVICAKCAPTIIPADKEGEE